MKTFSFLSIASVGLTLGIAMSVKMGIALVTPHFVQGIMGLTEFINTPEFLSVILPPLSFSVFQHFLSLPYFTDNSKSATTTTDSEVEEVPTSLREVISTRLQLSNTNFIATGVRPLASSNPLFQPLTPAFPQFRTAMTSITPGSNPVVRGLLRVRQQAHDRALKEKDLLINQKITELVDAKRAIAAAGEKLAQANGKLSFIGKYLSPNAIDSLYSLQYTGFTTSLYILSVSLGILLDSLMGLSINTATLFTVSAITNMGIKKNPILLLT